MKKDKTTRSHRLGIKSFFEKNQRINTTVESLIIVFWYSVFGFLWIIGTDSLLGWLIQDDHLYKEIQTYKGWLFVLLTVVFIFIIVKRRMDLINEAIDDMMKTKTILSSTEEALHIQTVITHEIIEMAPVMIVIWDNQGALKSVNPYTFEVLGYPSDFPLVNQWDKAFMNNENVANLSQVFKHLQVEGHLMNYETELVDSKGQKLYIIWNSGTLSKTHEENEYVSFGVDITKRRLAENTLKGLAYTDSLTGLNNRVAIVEAIQTRLDKKMPFALIYLDLDNFKYVNDSLGHHVGDELLKYLATCLRKSIRKKDFLARLGGDEFGIIIDSYKDRSQVFDMLDKFKKEAGKTWYIYNHNFYISISAGVVIAYENGNDVTTLTKNADIAMYASKREGKDRTMFYEETIEQNNLYHIEMAKKLQNAIDSSQFELFFQPVFDLTTQEIHSFEALLRWNEATRGYISPAEFIPFAEETGQIFAIERWVFEAALSQIKRWNEAGYRQFKVSINLSSKSLISEVSFKTIEKQLKSYKGDLSRIVIEITETALISDLNQVIARVHALKSLGVQIALDDFGTGYSSLTHLKALPVDYVKLDRSFISQIENKGKDELIIRSVIELVNSLHYQLVAEGIENQDQYDYLLKNNCHLGQGYLMSKPLPIAQVNHLLEKKITKKED